MSLKVFSLASLKLHEPDTMNFLTGAALICEGRKRQHQLPLLLKKF
jgi:hypothetical protein